MNTPATSPRPAPRGFTLIELLTVIAIIGILAAIIIPTVGAVRRTAQAASCVSNLRQIGVAMQLYARENRNLLPKPYNSAETDWQKKNWMYAIQPYLIKRGEQTTQDRLALSYDGVYRCPGKPNWNIDGPTDAYRISYGMNVFERSPAPYSENLAISRDTARNLSIFQIPSKTMLVMDRATFTEAGTEAAMPPYIETSRQLYRLALGLWHNGKDNVVFLDGHVEAVPREGLNYYLMKHPDDSLHYW